MDNEYYTGGDCSGFDDCLAKCKTAQTCNGFTEYIRYFTETAGSYSISDQGDVEHTLGTPLDQFECLTFPDDSTIFQSSSGTLTLYDGMDHLTSDCTRHRAKGMTRQNCGSGSNYDWNSVDGYFNNYRS